MAKVGQIYRLDRAPIYMRLTSREGNGWRGICVEPRSPNELVWVPGYHIDLEQYFTMIWTLVTSDLCLKCMRTNPCRKMERLCSNCRGGKWK